MRIGIFTDFSLPHIGGVETSIFHQHRALLAAGHDVYIISPPMRGADQINDELENVIRLKSPIPLNFDGAGLYIHNKRHCKKLDALKLDAVHLQSEFSMGSYGLKYAKSRKLPAVYTAHTFYPPQIELFMTKPKIMAILAELAQARMLGKLRPAKTFTPMDGYLGIACHSFAQKKILNFWMRFASATDVILAPSRRMHDYVSYYVKDKPVHYIPNPFSSLLTDTDEAAEPVHHPIRLMTSSVLRPEKRTQFLVEAISKLSRQQRQKITLDLYGGGMMQKDIEKMVKKYKLENTVTMHGAVDNRISQRAMMKSDVIVSTSVGFDNQPMSILEGLHAGNAVLYCDKYITEGTDSGNSVLAESTAEGLAEAIGYIAAHPGEVTKMKRNSKKLAKRFTYKSFVDKYEKILKDLV